MEIVACLTLVIIDYRHIGNRRDCGVSIFLRLSYRESVDWLHPQKKGNDKRGLKSRWYTYITNDLILYTCYVIDSVIDS